MRIQRLRKWSALRSTGSGAGIVATAVACLLVAPVAAMAQPVNPTDGQISAAQQAADAAATEVGEISAQLATAQAAVVTAEGRANIALDTYEGEHQAYLAAQAKADAAAAAERQAQQQLDQAEADLADFARDSYISGSTSSRTTVLLSAGSPSQMLERVALLDASGDHRSDVVDRASAAQRQATAAAEAARTTLREAVTLQQEAATALATAERDEAAARQQAAAFAARQAQLEAQLQQARQAVAALEGERTAAVDFARAQAAATRSTRLPAPGVAVATAEAAGPGSPATAAAAIAAAERWLGTRYAWGGGSLTGPSLGFGIDEGVVGFDCSGLTRYAYAQAGVTIPRQSTEQYAALPKVSGADLRPGDLLFYAFDTSDPATIHHVTLYLGDGRMVEAPESGETVHVTAVRWDGYLGAVRPTG